VSCFWIRPRWLHPKARAFGPCLQRSRLCGRASGKTLASMVGNFACLELVLGQQAHNLSSARAWTTVVHSANACGKNFWLQRLQSCKNKPSRKQALNDGRARAKRDGHK
jgi:hypothetical protein